MSWSDFFYGIEDLFDDYLMVPLDALRELELESWFLANALNWVFALIGLVALIYWMLQLKKFNEEGKEDTSSTAHSYLG